MPEMPDILVYVSALERLLGESIAAIDHDGCRLLKLGPSQFAVILPDCDRRLAVELSNHLVSDCSEAFSKLSTTSSQLAFLNRCSW